MEVYEFEKTLMNRMEEAEAVLCWEDAVMPASRVKKEWCRYIELIIEPTGWQAIWKIPRVICEELRIPYPTIVGGTVEQVLFEELKAIFSVTAVKDEDVHIPERHEVSLIDLWPTIEQENSALNANSTADCIDRLRHFYTQIWMPWDNDSDDDRDWVKCHLQSRLRLACDLNKNKLSRQLTAHIRSLIAEARYLQERVEYLELDLNDDDEPSSANKENDMSTADGAKKLNKSEADASLNKSHVPDLMKLHLRLAIIRSEMELLENEEMRFAYGDLNTQKHLRLMQAKQSINKSKLCFIVMHPQELQAQLDLLQLAKQEVTNDCLVQPIASLQDALGVCESTDHILLSSGMHTVKFLERLNDKGSIKGLLKHTETLFAGELATSALQYPYSVISTTDDDSMLFVIDGDFVLEKLVLDCRHVRTGIYLKSGRLRLRHCRLIGNDYSSTQEAILCGANAAELVLEHCIIEDFATGITHQYGGKTSYEFNNAIIRNCKTGIELYEQSIKMKYNGVKSTFENCNIAIYMDVDSPDVVKQATKFDAHCIFKKCKREIFNEEQNILQKKARKQLLMDHETSFEDLKCSP